jgi:hypothetical protein
VRRVLGFKTIPELYSYVYAEENKDKTRLIHLIAKTTAYRTDQDTYLSLIRNFLSAYFYLSVIEQHEYSMELTKQSDDKYTFNSTSLHSYGRMLYLSEDDSFKKEDLFITDKYELKDLAKFTLYWFFVKYLTNPETFLIAKIKSLRSLKKNLDQYFRNVMFDNNGVFEFNEKETIEFRDLLVEFEGEVGKLLIPLIDYHMESIPEERKQQEFAYLCYSYFDDMNIGLEVSELSWAYKAIMGEGFIYSIPNGMKVLSHVAKKCGFKNNDVKKAIIDEINRKMTYIEINKKYWKDHTALFQNLYIAISFVDSTLKESYTDKTIEYLRKFLTTCLTTMQFNTFATIATLFTPEFRSSDDYAGSPYNYNIREKIKLFWEVLMLRVSDTTYQVFTRSIADIWNKIELIKVKRMIFLLQKLDKGQYTFNICRGYHYGSKNLEEVRVGFSFASQRKLFSYFTIYGNYFKTSIRQLLYGNLLISDFKIKTGRKGEEDEADNT